MINDKFKNFCILTKLLLFARKKQMKDNIFLFFFFTRHTFVVTSVVSVQTSKNH